MTAPDGPVIELDPNRLIPARPYTLVVPGDDEDMVTFLSGRQLDVLLASGVKARRAALELCAQLDHDYTAPHDFVTEALPLGLAPGEVPEVCARCAAERTVTADAVVTPVGGA